MLRPKCPPFAVRDSRDSGALELLHTRLGLDDTRIYLLPASLSREHASMLRSPALCRAPGQACPSSWSRHRPASSRLAAPVRRGAHRLAAARGGTPAGGSDDDDVLPPEPTPPDLRGITGDELVRRVRRQLAELDAYERAVERYKARQKAREAPRQPPALPPLACLAAEWDPVADSTLPEVTSARAAAAEAAATAAVAFADAAVGHEAAAEAAHAAAARLPAPALAAAGEEWLRASAAWRKASESLEAARRAQPGARVVQDAAAQVEAARRFKGQLRSLPSLEAEDLP